MPIATSQSTVARTASNKMKVLAPLKQFVFGYGSLICPKSRSITAPTLVGRDAIPALVKNVERTWAKKSKRGMTSMGVQLKEGTECLGVLIPVTDDEIKQFDVREVGYDRKQIPLSHIKQVPFLDPTEHYDEDNHIVQNVINDDGSANDNDNDDEEEEYIAWVYVPKVLEPPSEDHPIAQSYVDVILGGCLEISEEFAKEFVSNTKGWKPQEVVATDDDDISTATTECCSDDDDDDQEEEQLVWVNDRHDPIYPRFDHEYSIKRSKEMDYYLKKHRPVDFSRREKLQTHRRTNTV